MCSERSVFASGPHSLGPRYFSESWETTRLFTKASVFPDLIWMCSMDTFSNTSKSVLLAKVCFSVSDLLLAGLYKAFFIFV